jgi:GDP-mannose 6-dehydrogenase
MWYKHVDLRTKTQLKKGTVEVKIAVFGLGYVGVVSAACLARDGHEVIGVDPNPVKTDLVNQGKSPIVEPGLEELVASGVASGRLRAVSDCAVAVEHAEMMFVCVGTPGQANGKLDLSHVRRVCEQIGAELGKHNAFKVVVVRSTMLPGSMKSVAIPALEEHSRKQAGTGFGVCINPEFLREGTAIYDYDHPPKTIVGATDEKTAKTLLGIYAHLPGPAITTEIQIAEMVKYADNSWHALKVTFANEMGRVCKAMGIDSRQLMKLFVQDTKLNVSPAYLRPGFAFGGSCLPKDVRALTYQGRLLDVDTPVLSGILASNRVQIDHALNMIMGQGKKKIGFMGLSFKEGTDDLRESPVVTLAERLIGKGYELCIYDRNVKLASLVGANRDYILNHIPHIGRLLLNDAESLFQSADVVVMATGEKDFGELLRKHGSGKTVIDLVGVWNNSDRAAATSVEGYDGIAW